MFEDILAEFDFKIGANTGPTPLSRFDISQFNLEKQILLFIQKQKENLVKMQEILRVFKELS